MFEIVYFVSYVLQIMIMLICYLIKVKNLVFIFHMIVMRYYLICCYDCYYCLLLLVSLNLYDFYYNWQIINFYYYYQTFILLMFMTCCYFHYQSHHYQWPCQLRLFNNRLIINHCYLHQVLVPRWLLLLRLVQVGRYRDDIWSSFILLFFTFIILSRTFLTKFSFLMSMRLLFLFHCTLFLLSWCMIYVMFSNQMRDW